VAGGCSPGRGEQPQHTMCSPDGIRTHATAVRGRRPRPLDDGARTDPSCQHSSLTHTRLIGCGGQTLLGYQDSNLEWLNQNQLCCQLHHTPLADLKLLVKRSAADHTSVMRPTLPAVVGRRADYQTIGSHLTCAQPGNGRRAAAADCGHVRAAPVTRTMAGLSTPR
jgi:hypothetical protein